MFRHFFVFFSKPPKHSIITPKNESSLWIQGFLSSNGYGNRWEPLGVWTGWNAVWLLPGDFFFKKIRSGGFWQSADCNPKWFSYFEDILPTFQTVPGLLKSVQFGCFALWCLSLLLVVCLLVCLVGWLIGLLAGWLLACLLGWLLLWLWLWLWLLLLLLLFLLLLLLLLWWWWWWFLWVLGFVNVFFFCSPLRDVLCSSSQDMLESGLQSTPHHRYVTEYHYRFYQSSKPQNQHWQCRHNHCNQYLYPPAK